jgi:two-component system, NtrC family, sensor histidine kinase GlrK
MAFTHLKNIRFSYPKSFLKLLLLGFSLTMLPLLFAFANATHYLDELAVQSQKVVAQAVQATRSSRVLVEQLNLMERSARQYYVLRDKLLLDRYDTAHHSFTAAVSELSALPLNAGQRQELAALKAREAKLYEMLVLKFSSLADPKLVIDEFIELSSQAQNILAENNQLIDRESAILEQTAERAQKIMWWQTLTLVPVALFVALVITFLVAQPIRLMDSAIRRLGDGDYAASINIDGPGDIRVLGERLDWLRGQLQQLDEQKQRFLRHVSHELKTPLTAIREGSELLVDEVGGALSPQQQEIVSILNDNSIRLQKMIENLLNYTAVQFQKPQLKLENIHLSALVQQVLNQHILTLNSKKIAIVSNLNSVEFMGDREKLHSILDNLLSNAIKYTPRDGEIRLAVTASAEAVSIDVHDSGPGIAKQDESKLFDPFYRGEGGYESYVTGSGLGLSIVKEYVAAHEGRIRLIDEPQGAHFCITLPMQKLAV